MILAGTAATGNTGIHTWLTTGASITVSYGFIKQSTSTHGAPVLFIHKKKWFSLLMH